MRVSTRCQYLAPNAALPATQTMSHADVAFEDSSAKEPVAPAIRVRHLIHDYTARPRRKALGPNQEQGAFAPNGAPAINDLNLDVDVGITFGVLGPNGSGKTSLFQILATLLRPTSGRVAVFGHDVSTDPDQARRLLGIVFQSPSLDAKLTATENLLHQGHLYGLRGRPLRSRIEALLKHFGLIDRRRELVENFSGGMRRRLELAKSLLHQPRLLLLDEPTAGLDPGVRRDFWNELQRLRRLGNATVALTTHLIEEARHCDQLAILNQGRLIALDTPANLTARINSHVVTVVPCELQDASTLVDSIAARFGPWPEGGAPRLVDGEIRLETPDGTVLAAELTRAFRTQIQRLSIGRPTLEDVFLHLTGHTLWDTPRTDA